MNIQRHLRSIFLGVSVVAATYSAKNMFQSRKDVSDYDFHKSKHIEDLRFQIEPDVLRQFAYRYQERMMMPAETIINALETGEESIKSPPAKTIRPDYYEIQNTIDRQAYFAYDRKIKSLKDEADFWWYALAFSCIAAAIPTASISTERWKKYQEKRALAECFNSLPLGGKNNSPRDPDERSSENFQTAYYNHLAEHQADLREERERRARGGHTPKRPIDLDGPDNAN